MGQSTPAPVLVAQQRVGSPLLLPVLVAQQQGVQRSCAPALVAQQQRHCFPTGQKLLTKLCCASSRANCPAAVEDTVWRAGCPALPCNNRVGDATTADASGGLEVEEDELPAYLPTQRLLDANVHVWMHQHANAMCGKRMNVACRQQSPRPPFHSPTYS